MIKKKLIIIQCMSQYINMPSKSPTNPNIVYVRKHQNNRSCISQNHKSHIIMERFLQIVACLCHSAGSSDTGTATQSFIPARRIIYRLNKESNIILLMLVQVFIIFDLKRKSHVIHHYIHLNRIVKNKLMSCSRVAAHNDTIKNWELTHQAG